MKSLVVLSFVLTLSAYHTFANKVGVVAVDDGRVGIGLITGGKFEAGSFSINSPGRRHPPQRPVYDYEDSEDDGDGDDTIIQRPTNDGRPQDNNRPPHHGSADAINHFGGGNRKPLRTPIDSGEGSKGGQGGTRGGQIVIGPNIVPNNNKGNKRRNRNREPYYPDSGTLETIFVNDGGNNDFPNVNYIRKKDGLIQIDAITAGNKAHHTIIYDENINEDGATNVPKKVNDANNGNPNTGNKAVGSIGHGANNYGHGNGGDGSNHGQNKSGHNSRKYEDEPWIWSS